MRKADIKKVMVFDQNAKSDFHSDIENNAENRAHPAFLQLMTKAKEIFHDSDVEFIRVTGDTQEEVDNPQTAVTIVERAVRAKQPDILLIGATSLGEEVAPSLGVRLRTGVAAHCVDITVNEDGRMVYMVPAFGGKFIGEIFIPGDNCAIATVKPGIFAGDEKSAGEYRTLTVSLTGIAAKPDHSQADSSQYGSQCESGQSHSHAESSKVGGSKPHSQDGNRGIQTGECLIPEFRLTGREEKQLSKSPIEKAKLIFCGGFGIGSAQNWQKLEALAESLGGGVGCTRPVVDMGWGPDEYSMIGTSGKTVRPKVYIGFGISGAAHHICGIKDADIIININNDKEAEVFASSDHKAVIDAQAVINSLLQRIGGK